MNGEATLLNNIFSLTRGDLDSAVFPMPQPAKVLAESCLVRLTRLARFWRHPDFTQDALLQSTIDLLSGFHAQSSPFILLIRGEERNAEVWIGGPKANFTKDLISRVLRGAFPDCRSDEESCFPLSHFESLSHAAVLTGTPTLREVGGQKVPAEQIERVIRGLQGRKWGFMISGHPLAPSVVMRGLNELGSEIRDTRATFLLKQSPIDEFNRTAQRYVDLLEAKLRRFDTGRMQGLWLTNVALFATDARTLALGKGLLHSAYSGEQSLPDPIRCCLCSPEAQQTPSLEPINTAELAAFARPPHEEYPGYEVVDYTRYGVCETSVSTGDGLISVGGILDRGVPTGNSVRISRDDLTKHGLIVGITGSGKTNTCLGLLRQIWAGGARVPFLVIESAKSEYRDLLSHPEFSDLKVFTVADETISPLRLNPFEAPDGVLVQTHVDYVKSLFSAAFVLYPPMPYVLEQSIQEIYEDRGWDLAINVNPRGKSPRAFPTLSDLAEKVSAVIERMGYDERITMDVRAGLLARINQLRMGGGKGLMFDVRQSTSGHLLFERPCILELKNLVSDDEKAFLIGLILIRLYEHAEVSRGRRDGKLHHVTLIEEAHRLLRSATTEQGLDSANPRGRAIEVFANILSEIRAFGEGVLIAEQIPTKLTPDCIKNTSLKVVHRLLVEEDRNLVGKAINLDENQIRGLGVLATGEAVVFAEHLQKPVLARMARTTETPPPVENQQIASKMADVRRENSGVCRYCRQTGSLCRPIHGLSRNEFTLAFQRFFNALRFRSSAIRAHYDGLVQLHTAIVGAGPAPFNCFMARLADAECERRGQFVGWPFSAVDESVEALLDEADLIGRGQPETGKLAEKMKQLHLRPEGPFAGCIVCSNRCQYRFDAAENMDALSKEFRAKFMDQRCDLSSVAATCWEACKTLPQDAKIAQKETRLCFAVQQLHRLALVPAVQQKNAARFAECFGMEVPNGTRRETARSDS